MFKPLVCICMPCFNNEKTIYKSLKSVLDQDYDNVRVKVFDNASTDGTRDIIKGFVEAGYEIELFERCSTVSLEENFTTCIENAEGLYSGIFHADDMYEKNIVAHQVNYLNSHLESVAVYTHSYNIDENDSMLGERFIPYELRHQEELELDEMLFTSLTFKYGNFVTCPSMLFKTDVLQGHIKTFSRELYKSAADLDVWFRLVEVGKIGFINKPLISYRLSNASFSFNLARVRVCDSDMFLVLKSVLVRREFTFEQKIKFNDFMNFLLMKDRVNTNLNRMLFNDNDFQNLDVFKNIKLALISKFHLKFFLLSVLAKLLLNMPQNKILLKLIKSIKSPT